MTVITGNDGSNALDGGAGDDVIYARGAADYAAVVKAAPGTVMSVWVVRVEINGPGSGPGSINSRISHT